MIQSLKEKIIPSLIATLIVGIVSSFITFKVMAYQVGDMSKEIDQKALKETVTKNEQSSKDRDKDLKEQIEGKADKEVLSLIYDQVKTNGRILESMRRKE